MSLCETLKGQMSRGRELLALRVEKMVDTVLKDFRRDCLLKALRCHTSHRASYDKSRFFKDEWDWDLPFQDEFAARLQAKASALLGQGKAKLEVGSCKPMIILAANWHDAAGENVTVSSSESNASRKCLVCLEELPSLALTPCGHKFCGDCVRSFPAGKRCPLCRQCVQRHEGLQRW